MKYAALLEDTYGRLCGTNVDELTDLDLLPEILFYFNQLIKIFSF